MCACVPRPYVCVPAIGRVLCDRPLLFAPSAVSKRTNEGEIGNRGRGCCCYYDSDHHPQLGLGRFARRPRKKDNEEKEETIPGAVYIHTFAHLPRTAIERQKLYPSLPQQKAVEHYAPEPTAPSRTRHPPHANNTVHTHAGNALHENLLAGYEQLSRLRSACCTYLAIRCIQHTAS